METVILVLMVIGALSILAFVHLWAVPTLLVIALEALGIVTLTYVQALAVWLVLRFLVALIGSAFKTK